MNLIDYLLPIITLILGGGNIFQFFFWKSEKKKYNAEAESASIEAKQKCIDLQQDQYDYILGKLTSFQQDYFELVEKVKTVQDKHAEEMQESNKRFISIINDKCNEIAELKSKIIYFKGLRCYRSDCSKRIDKNPKYIENYGQEHPLEDNAKEQLEH